METNFAFLHKEQTQRLLAAFPAQAIRFVGGAVRDGLLGQPAHDLDLATSLSPAQVQHLLTQAGIRNLPTGLAHGTISAWVATQRFEITTLRRDVATDGRHAEIAFTDDWREDAARRDFTFNALYLSAQGELFDYFEGETDLRAGRIRFIGKADKRIAEDYLRILRLFRFYGWFGREPLSDEAIAACDAAAGKIDSLSGERIQQEMVKLFAAPGLVQALRSMPASVWRATLGAAPMGLEPLQALMAREQALGQSADAWLRLAVCLPGSSDAARLAKRWRTSHAQAQELAALFDALEALPAHAPLAAQKKWIRACGAAGAQKAVLLGWARMPEAQDWQALWHLLGSWSVPQFPLTGADLLARGFQPGKALGAQLGTLEALWEESEYRLSKEALLAHLPRG